MFELTFGWTRFWTSFQVVFIVSLLVMKGMCWFEITATVTNENIFAGSFVWVDSPQQYKPRRKKIANLVLCRRSFWFLIIVSRAAIIITCVVLIWLLGDDISMSGKSKQIYFQNMVYLKTPNQNREQEKHSNQFIYSFNWIN